MTMMILRCGLTRRLIDWLIDWLSRCGLTRERASMRRTVPSCLALAMRQKIAMSFLDQRCVEYIGYWQDYNLKSIIELNVKSKTEVWGCPTCPCVSTKDISIMSKKYMNYGSFYKAESTIMVEFAAPGFDFFSRQNISMFAWSDTQTYLPKMQKPVLQDTWEIGGWKRKRGGSCIISKFYLSRLLTIPSSYLASQSSAQNNWICEQHWVVFTKHPRPNVRN